MLLSYSYGYSISISLHERDQGTYQRMMCRQVALLRAACISFSQSAKVSRVLFYLYLCRSFSKHLLKITMSLQCNCLSAWVTFLVCQYILEISNFQCRRYSYKKGSLKKERLYLNYLVAAGGFPKMLACPFFRIFNDVFSGQN